MALVQYAAGISGMSGAVAGSVYSHNRGGAYVRRRSVPTNPNSQRQQDQRAIFGIGSAVWKILSPAQKEAWRARTQTHPVVNRFGASIILSAQQQFVQLYSNTATYDPTSLPLGAPPADPVYVLPVTDGADLVGSAGAETLTYDTGAARALGDITVIFASPPMSRGRVFAKNLMRLVLVDTAAGVVAPGTTIDFSAAYFPVWGALTGTINKRIIADFYSYSNGELSVVQTLSGVMGA
jgi:hypothetical protein